MDLTASRYDPVLSFYGDSDETLGFIIARNLLTSWMSIEVFLNFFHVMAHRNIVHFLTKSHIVKLFMSAKLSSIQLPVFGL